MADDEALKATVEAEGNTIDANSLPEGLRPEREPEPPQMETVKINGVDVSLTVEQAQAYREQMQSYEEELQQARQRPEPPKVETPSDDWEDLWFTDPAKAVEKIEERVTSKLTQTYQAERAQEKWWGDFDRENPNLSDKHWLVEAVLREHMDDLGPLSPQAGRRKLAELVKEQIMGLAPQKETEPDDTNTLEGGAVQPNLRVVSGDTEQPSSLSALIRAKAAQRVHKKGGD